MTPMGTNQERGDGHLGERILRYYEARAQGGVGLVIAGVASICWPRGAANPNQAAISDDRFLPDWQELARRVHRHGAKLAVQLQHASKVAVEDMAAGRALWVPSEQPFKRSDLYDALTPEEVASATSALRRPGAGVSFHEMSHDDIAEIVEAFAEAADRARRAGADAVELHAGHGYMLASFLSPASNRREDEYGGAIENRARMLVETVRAVRARVGEDFAVWCRLDAVEIDIDGGITPEDGRRAAELAVEAGVDAIHVSAYANSGSGVAFTKAPLPHAPGAYLELAAAIKQRVSVPVIAVGRIEPEEGERVLREGGADFIAMGRKLLADPELPNKLARGEGDRVRPCIYSYNCVGNVFLRQAARCGVNPAMGREAELALVPAEIPRSVLVVGGGPAGLELARIAALRGHRVMLFERDAALGGRARVAGRVNPPIARWLAWAEAELGAVGVKAQCGEALDADRIAALAPDVVVLATGGRCAAPALEGVPVVTLDDAGTALDVGLPGPRTVVAGGDLIALELADHLTRVGHEVVLAMRGTHWGAQMSPPRRWRVLDALARAGVRRVAETQLRSAGEGAVEISSADGEERLAVDCVVWAEEPAPDDALARALAARGIAWETIGDAAGMAYLTGAVEAATRLGVSL